MNKYVVRTSLVWLVLIAGGVGFYVYQHRMPAEKEKAEVQPLAVGSASPQIDRTPAVQTPLAAVELTPERRQSIDVQTGIVAWKRVADRIQATGTVDIDERLISYVQVRFSGYVRQVFANATYQFVHKGDRLLTIYSPELVATQNEFLLAVRHEHLLSGSHVDGVASGAEALTAAAEARLRQWDIAPADIAAVKESGKPVRDLEITSPVSGYVTERNALPNLYVEPATRLYAIADLSRVWVYAQIFQDDVGRLKPGDRARITVDSYSSRVFQGRIESILPQVDLATRTVRVRIEMANADLRLKPGMFVNADFEASPERQLVVPAAAIVQSGERQIAFLDQGNGRLEPTEVVTGRRVVDDVIVMKGLSAGQRVVTSANFLIDSESQLQAAAGSYLPPTPVANAAAPQATTMELTTEPAPPRRGSNTVRVKLTGTDGKPVTGADVSVTFYMAAMPAMGMAAMTTRLKLHGMGGGLYEGAGVLDSGGTWRVTITAQKNGQNVATKQLQVNATGGM